MVNLFSVVQVESWCFSLVRRRFTVCAEGYEKLSPSGRAMQTLVRLFLSLYMLMYCRFNCAFVYLFSE